MSQHVFVVTRLSEPNYTTAVFSTYELAKQFIHGFDRNKIVAESMFDIEEFVLNEV